MWNTIRTNRNKMKHTQQIIYDDKLRLSIKEWNALGFYPHWQKIANVFTEEFQSELESILLEHYTPNE